MSVSMCVCVRVCLHIHALQAELNVYEQFAVQHCKGRVDPPAVCHEIEEAVLDLRHQLQVAAKSSVSQSPWWCSFTIACLQQLVVLRCDAADVHTCLWYLKFLH